MNEEDEVTGTVGRLLISATDISFDNVFGLVASYHGTAYPAHIDKTTTSLLSNLGFVPPDSTFRCAEIHDFRHLHQIRREHPYFLGWRMISSSDAHYLPDIHEAEYQIYPAGREAADVVAYLQSPPGAEDA